MSYSCKGKMGKQKKLTGDLKREPKNTPRALLIYAISGLAFGTASVGSYYQGTIVTHIKNAIKSEISNVNNSKESYTITVSDKGITACFRGQEYGIGIVPPENRIKAIGIDDLIYKANSEKNRDFPIKGKLSNLRDLYCLINNPDSRAAVAFKNEANHSKATYHFTEEPMPKKPFRLDDTVNAFVPFYHPGISCKEKINKPYMPFTSGFMPR